MNPPFEARRPFALPSDFYRLGLKRGECNSIAIRDATQMAVHRLADTSADQSFDLIDRQLGQLATSAYRLLNPRYRMQLYERVQLSYAIDRDEVVESNFKLDRLLRVPEASVAFEGIQESQELVEVHSHSGYSLERAREVVRWIRHADAERLSKPPRWVDWLFGSLRSWLGQRTN